MAECLQPVAVRLAPATAEPLDELRELPGLLKPGKGAQKAGCEVVPLVRAAEGCQDADATQIVESLDDAGGHGSIALWTP